MIARIKGFDLEININDIDTTVLVIKKSDVFRSVIDSINDNINGIFNNDFIIEVDNKQFDYVKELLLISDYFHFKFDDKSIHIKLYKLLEELVRQDFNLQQKVEYERNLLLKALYEITLEVDFGLTCTPEINLTSLFKVFDFRIDKSETHNTIERLFLYIDVVKNLKLCSFLVLINLNSFFDSEEVMEIFSYLHYKKIKFMCLESYFYDKISVENLYIIDEDLIEFNYSKHQP